MTTQRLADLVDYSTFPPGGGCDLTGYEIRGARVALEHVVRSWLSPRGSLKWTPGRGVDIRALENADLTPAEISAVARALVVEARQVDFVEDCEVTITLAGVTLTIEATVRLVDGGTYPLAVQLSEAGAVLAAFGGV